MPQQFVHIYSLMRRESNKRQPKQQEQKQERQRQDSSNNLIKPRTTRTRKQKLKPFHLHLLQMNYFKDIVEHQQKLAIVDNNNPLESDKFLTEMSLKRKSSITESLPLRFTCEQNYLKIWENLFYEEAAAQIYRNKMQMRRNNKGATVYYGEIMNVEDTEIHLYKMIHFKKEGNISYDNFGIGTLVILSPKEPPQGVVKDYPHLIGIVEVENMGMREGNVVMVRAMLNEAIFEERYPGEWESAVTTKRWYIQQLSAIHTLERQYQALASFPENLSPYLKQIFLHPSPDTKNEKKLKIPIKLDMKLKETFNESQYKAIYQCLKQTGITLIQGPPGTGKTKTVLGTLSVLLSSFNKAEQEEEEPLILNWKRSASVNRCNDKLLNPWLYADYENWRDAPLIEEEDDPLNLTSFYVKSKETDREVRIFRKEEGVVLPGKVLICGPSNASVDQIIRKMLAEELYDQDGLKYLPNFVRIGENYDPQLKQYSLDFLAEKLCQRQNGSDLQPYRNRILSEYRLVFSTLSAAGSPILENSSAVFDTVVIDEAGQSIEISNLIPLMYGCQRLILIGDPNQLPATVFSQKSLQHKYDQSLFQRFMKAGYPLSILRVQYRMHPQIGDVIGDNFYHGNVANWEGLKAGKPQNLPHAFVIFHIDNSYEKSHQKSYRNEQEAKAIKDFIFETLLKNTSYTDIGVISPYSQQVALLQELILPKNTTKKNHTLNSCQVKTIDSFQGREKDVIVFSAVRSRFFMAKATGKVEENKRKGIGFVGDHRRINVSLSRAKQLCVVFGDVKRLAICGIWKSIIETAMQNGQVYEYQNSKNFHTQFKNQPQKFLMKALSQQNE